MDVPQLVRRCLAGDQAAVVQLVRHYEGMVFGLCFRMLGHRQDAEDVTQQVFLRALRSLARWDPTRDFKPWLLAIAGNRCRTVLATRRRKQAPGDLVEDLPDRHPDPLAERNLNEEVELGLNRLRDEYRRAFLLFHREQLSYLEIAEALGVPVGTVKTWVHRARRQLADHLVRRGVVEGAVAS